MVKKAVKRKVKRKASTGGTRKRGKPSLLTLMPEYRKGAYSKRVSVLNEQYRSELMEAYLHQGLVLYVGAGVSRSVGLPSWPELIRSLTVTMMTRKVTAAMSTLGDIGDDKYWEALMEIQEDFEKTADYDRPVLMMARSIKDEMGNRLPYAIARRLYHYRFRRWADFRSRPSKGRGARMSGRPLPPLPSSPLLDELASLSRPEREVKGVQAIVNYNYDDILDEKLREQSVRCVTVCSGRDRVLPRDLPCYHVHGVLPMKVFARRSKNEKDVKFGNFVFSEDEYHEEYADPYRWSNMTQIGQLGRYIGLFIGLSMEDPNIRRLIDVTHRQYPEIKNYAILARKVPLAKAKDSKNCVLRNLFEEVESRSFEKIGVSVAWVDSHDEIPVFLRSIHA